MEALSTAVSEGHKALVHTAAASNLGQMLNKICLEDNASTPCAGFPRDALEEKLRGVTLRALPIRVLCRFRTFGTVVLLS